MFKFEFATGLPGESPLESASEFEGETPPLTEAEKIECGEFIPSISISAKRIQFEVAPIYKRTLADIRMESIESDTPLGPSDLVSGLYEGGFKTWEGSLDLLKVLPLNLPGKKILELGCGSGLAGIQCLLNGACVDFQDYNREVLVQSTFYNVLLNGVKPPLDGPYDVVELNWDVNSPACKSRYFYGDWGSLASRFPELQGQYDIILTADTIYEHANVPSLLSLIRFCLKTDGVAYIAAKNNYFGCTGSLPLFASHVSTQSLGTLSSIYQVNDTVIRQVLLFTPSPSKI